MSTEVAVTPNIELDPVALALVRADVPSARIESLAKDFGELAKRTAPIETDEEYELIHRAQLSCRDVRVAVVAALKAEREDAVKYQKHVVAEEKRILAIIEQTEEPLKKLKDEYNKRAELKALAEANAWAEKMKMRKEAAFDVGFTFNGMAYTCSKEDGTGEYWTLREDQIAGMALSDEALFALLDDIVAQLKVTREINAEAAAKAKEEQDAKEAAMKAEADRIAAAEAEMERKQNELYAREKEMNAKVNEIRKNELIAMGMRPGQYSDCVFLTREGGGFTYPTEQLHQFENWDAEKLSLKPLIQGRDNLEREDRLKAEQERVARDQKMKEEAAAAAVEAERVRLANEAEAKKKQEELAAQQEQERIAALGDMGRAEGLMLALVNIPIDNYTSAAGRAMALRMKKFKDSAIEIVDTFIRDNSND